jgi:serine/threonine protein kinase
MQPVGISSSGGTSSGMNGPRMLRSRTVSHDLHKIRVIGKGRFGEVWLCKPRAEYDHQLIAMKVFQYRHEAAWTREIDIYNTYMLNHNNILKFLGNDRMEFPHTVELCTLFEYHENGTLYEYLKSRESLSFSESHFMGVSFFTGLEYLHRTITAGVQKPGIAHRDIKSRNILVKQDQSLCISDLGMAVKASTSDDGTESVDEEPTNKLSGTKRYMSPEILNGSMDYKKFISYTRSDIYSASLTLWELFACCTINGVHHTYNLPYYNMVPLDPDINQMKECVCILNKRPELPSFWDDNDNFSSIKSIIEEGWADRPNTRPTALSILKKLQKIDTKIKL